MGVSLRTFLDTKEIKKLLKIRAYGCFWMILDIKVGWLTGIEPATTGITIRGSTN